MTKKVKDQTDRILLERWRNGDRQAFNTLFDRHFNKLLQYSAARLSDIELAEEITMDVMMRLWQNQEKIQIESSLAPWLFRSLKNAVIDHKRKKALQTIAMDEVEFEHPQAISPEERYHSSELEHIYNQALKELSPQRRKVFELSRKEGKSLKEISEETSLSLSTVKQHISASLQTFREVMHPHTDLVYCFMAMFCLFA